MQWSITLGDIGSIAIAGVALFVAWVALRETRHLASMSASRPFLLERLYELYHYRASRRLNTEDLTPEALEADMERLKHELALVRADAPVLEAAGFADDLAAVNRRASEFQAVSAELSRSMADGNTLSSSDESRFRDALLMLDTTLQKLLGDLDDRMRLALKDPLDRFRP